jgi:hypothetical protein
MTCKICNHPNRLEIDREVVKGLSLAAIARKFDVNYNGLSNHANNHIARQLAQVWEKRALEEKTNMLERIEQIVDRAEDIFNRNYKAKKDSLALKALDSQRNTFDLLLKISTALHQAKLVELEIKRQESGIAEAESKNAITAENLKVLNPTEQNLLKQLLLKVVRRDADMKIVPRTPTEFPRPRRRTEVDPIVGDEEEKVVETDEDTDTDDPLQVRPVPSTQIPSTKRNDYPLNRSSRK